jgi:hypothetical protein
MNAAGRFFGAVVLCGCAAGGPKPASDASSNAGPGTLGVPIQRCGAEDSYRYVAEIFRCADGKNPLGGSLAAGHDARRGSVPDSRTGHHIDIYEVPCSEGTKRVYVDLYGCPQEEEKLRGRMSRVTKVDPVQSDFDAGRYSAVIDRCRFLQAIPQNEAGVFCLPLYPASLYMIGDKAAAVEQMGRTCSAFPEPSPDSDFRARLVLQAVGSIMQAYEQRGKALSNDQVGRFAEAIRSACHVPQTQIERLLNDAQQSKPL